MQKWLKIKQKRVFRGIKRYILIFGFMVFFVESFFPQFVLAQEIQVVNSPVSTAQPEVLGPVLPKINNIVLKPKKTMRIAATAYTSTPEETDNTPCITANGFNVCENNQENVIAANFLPFGTKVRLPEIFGDRIFTVQDRMNARYYYRLDIWMFSKVRAYDFGVQNVLVEIF